MPDYRIVVRPLPTQPDPHGQALLELALLLGLRAPPRLSTARLYFLRAELSPHGVRRACQELVSDPALESFQLEELQGASPQPNGHIEVSFRPGVLDREAESLLDVLRVMGLPAQAAQSGWGYELGDGLSRSELQALAEGLLVNPVVHTYALGALQPHFSPPSAALPQVERIELRGLSRAGLKALSRKMRLALEGEEMLAVQAFFAQLGRRPTRAELETVAQTWSEHCAHKTFRAEILYQGPEGSQRIPGLLETYIRRATEEAAKPWVSSALVDNAGVVLWAEGWQVAVKVETHNHPSAIEPFAGANTGVGGVVRDVLGVSARPVASTDVLAFAPADSPLPAGTLHPRRVEQGVIEGIADYGNKLGVPTVAGAILYHPGYVANPLVYCGCLGLAPAGSHPTHLGPTTASSSWAGGRAATVWAGPLSPPPSSRHRRMPPSCRSASRLCRRGW